MSNPSQLLGLPFSRPLLPEKHRDEFNAVIITALGPMVDIFSSPTQYPDSTFGTMLGTIVDRAKSFLRRKDLKDNLRNFHQDNLTELYAQQPQLRGILSAACKEKKFDHIVDLQILQVPSSPAHSERDVGSLFDSFERPYIGEALDGFFEYLSSNNKKFSEGSERPYYGKFCSIVQSSGTGKTRLLTEIRKKGVLTLYMNIRELVGSTFPARDEFPSRILTEDIDCPISQYTIRCCAFFTAIFTTLETVLSKLIQEDSDITDWNNQMCDMRPESPHRVEFFALFEAEYSKIYSKLSQVDTNPNAEAEPSTKKRKPNFGTGGPPKTTPPDTSIKNPLLKSDSSLVGAYKKMLNILPQKHIGDDSPELVIGIDEAHPLSKMNKQGFRPSDVLCRVINAYSRNSHRSTWVVFASTTSRVADFSAPQQIHPSLRIAEAGQLLYPPYTHLGWDQNADGINISPDEIASFRHIAGFGRPLWKSLVDLKDKNPDSIVTLALQKLRSSSEADVYSQKQVLAILSQRFALDVCFGHPDAVSYIEEGVASYLRICYSTVEDRTWSFTGYPSEPLLSCVSAHLLHKEEGSLAGALRILKEKVDNGLFEIGQSGELASRLVLLLAKDSYVRRDGRKKLYIQIPGGHDEWDVELIDCRKVSVIEFLEHLFGTSFWVKAGDAARESFQHAYVNFSHWVPMDGLISPRSEDGDNCTAEEWTLRHWYRTSAVQCCHNQPLVDKMIPIFFDDPTLSDDMNQRVSQMFISDKAGKKKHEKETNFITRTHDSIKCSSSLPFIALLLDLNVETNLKVSFNQKSSRFETDQCLRIYASGLSHATFPFLYSQPDAAKSLKGLISKPSEPTSSTRLQALVKYGRTVEASHMRWELGNQTKAMTMEKRRERGTETRP